jgi:methionyl-tRNA formyltransferase
MKVLVFCNNKPAAQIVFELIRKRVFAGLVIPPENLELLNAVKQSGYVSENEIHTPSLEDEKGLTAILKQVKPDVCFVLTFPKLFSMKLLSIPPMGFYNFHFGSLPQYRSADPVFWQIRKGEKTASLCVHKMIEQVDAGPILYQEEIPVHYADTYGSLLHRFAAFTTAKSDEILKLVGNADDTLSMQKDNGSIYLSKPKLNDVTLDWQQMNMEEIIATVNAANPWNRGAVTYIDGQEYKILQVTPAKYEAELPNKPGQVFFTDDEQGVFVICNNQELLRIDTIYTPVGYATGGRIAYLGITQGKEFNNNN